MESPPLVITSPAPSPSTSPTTSIAGSPASSTGNPAATFPPSPPSSCGDRSPPPKEPKLVIPPSIVVPVPKVALRKPILPFSIENILRPGFGSKVPISPPPQRLAFIPLVTDSVLRTPPKTPELSRNDSPVDLSHKKSLPAPQPLTIKQIQNLQHSSPPSTSSTSSQNITETKTISTNTVEATNTNSRVRYPDNPEELANPPVPEEDMVWPAWVYCTRYSDRPSSGPRSRRIKRRDRNPEEKRPRTAFTSEQLARLKNEFDANRYLDDKRRQSLARELNLNESQIKIWFQNKRAKDKKCSGPKNNGLAQHLIAQGLYNHSTMPVDEDDPYLNGTL